jgi:hypothetical protein
MPLKTPSSPSKSGGKPKGKTPSSLQSKGNAARKPQAARGKTARDIPPQPASVSWWASLTPERKLDVVGAIMAVVGLLTLLILFSAQRSAITGSMMRLLSQMFGWGIYILPVALILMGLWLVLRRIEKLPALSLERATGRLWSADGVVAISEISSQECFLTALAPPAPWLHCWHGC